MPIPDDIRAKLSAQMQKAARDLRQAARTVDGVRFPNLARMTHDYARTIEGTPLEAFAPEMWALLVANGFGLMRIAKDCGTPDGPRAARCLAQGSDDPAERERRAGAPGRPGARRAGPAAARPGERIRRGLARVRPGHRGRPSRLG
jgi:hypothetical protein